MLPPFAVTVFRLHDFGYAIVEFLCVVFILELANLGQLSCGRWRSASFLALGPTALLFVCLPSARPIVAVAPTGATLSSCSRVTSCLIDVIAVVVEKDTFFQPQA